MYQISEAAVAYASDRQEGEYTLEDYYRLPDERRVELIDGVFYDMSAPTSIHQLIGGSVYSTFFNYISRKGGKCLPFIAPIDVQLDCDDRTMVQPDVLILCDRDKLNRRNIYGAPDFILEVLSPSTRRKDMMLKLAKYSRAGVREYWIVDPERKNVLVYDLEHGKEVTIYGFTDQIPVAIFDGDCVVNFADIDAYVSFLYE